MEWFSKPTGTRTGTFRFLGKNTHTKFALLFLFDSPFTLGIDNRSRNLEIASDIFIENIVSYVFIFVCVNSVFNYR